MEANMSVRKWEFRKGNVSIFMDIVYAVSPCFLIILF